MGLDYGKIDAALAAALEDAGDDRDEARFSVFVHLDPAASARDRAALAGFGLPKAVTRQRGSIATATLTPQDIVKLSQQSIVRQLRLSTPLRLLGDE